MQIIVTYARTAKKACHKHKETETQIDEQENS